jgi:hypothetical protein
MFAFDTLIGHGFCGKSLIIKVISDWHYIYCNYIKY